MTEEIKALATALIPQEFKEDNFFLVMLFFQAHEIWGEDEEQLKLRNLTGNEWVNVHNIPFEDHLSALDAYSNIQCPASQLISAHSREDLTQKMNQMVLNYQNKEWLDENLYPYL